MDSTEDHAIEIRGAQDRSSDTCVKVAVRVRPLVERELQDGAAVCIAADEGMCSVQCGRDRRFTYDHVYGTSATQEHLYKDCVAPLVDGCFEGFNATVMAYGQTGSGKTFTMGLGADLGHAASDSDAGTAAAAAAAASGLSGAGITPRVVAHLFAAVAQREAAAGAAAAGSAEAGSSGGGTCLRHRVSVTFLEIHNEELRDLLAPQGASHTKGLLVREGADGCIGVAGAHEVVVGSAQELISLLASATWARATGTTLMNESSSRSHAICTITLTQGSASASSSLTSKLHLVDLAGSERTKRSGVAAHAGSGGGAGSDGGARFREAVNINQGLLALGNVISALGDERKRGAASHVPYRDSKLTRLLQDSLGGNSRTLMIACVSGADDSMEESLSTLKYANRARNIRNRPVPNRMPGGASGQQLLAAQADVLATAMGLTAKCARQLPPSAPGTARLEQVLAACANLSTAAACGVALNTLGALQLSMAREEEEGLRRRRSTQDAAVAAGGLPVASHPLLGLFAAAEEVDVAGSSSRATSMAGGGSGCVTEAGDVGDALAATRAELLEAQRALQEARDDLERDEIIFADQQRELDSARTELDSLRAAARHAATTHALANGMGDEDRGDAVGVHSRKARGATEDELVLYDDDLLPALSGDTGSRLLLGHAGSGTLSEGGAGDAHTLGLSEELDRALRQCAAADEQRKELEATVEQQQQDFDVVRTALEGRLRSLAGSIASQEALIQCLQAAEREARELSHACLERMRSLEGQIAVRESEVGELRAQLAAIEQDAARSAEERDAARREVEARLEEAQEQVESLRRALQDAERQRAERERQRANNRAQLLEAELRLLRSEHDALQRRLSDRSCTHEREADAHTHEVARLRRQADASKRRVAELEADAKAARALAKQKSDEAAAAMKRLRDAAVEERRHMSRVAHAGDGSVTPGSPAQRRASGVGASMVVSGITPDRKPPVSPAANRTPSGTGTSRTPPARPTRFASPCVATSMAAPPSLASGRLTLTAPSGLLASMCLSGGLSPAGSAAVSQPQRWLEQQVRTLTTRQEAEARVARLSARRTELVARKEALAAEDGCCDGSDGYSLEEAIDSVAAELAYVTDELQGARCVLQRAEGGALELRRRIASLPVSDVRKVLGRALEALAWAHMNAAAPPAAGPVNASATKSGAWLSGSSEGRDLGADRPSAAVVQPQPAQQKPTKVVAEQAHSPRTSLATAMPAEHTEEVAAAVFEKAEGGVGHDAACDMRASVSSWDSDSNAELPSVLAEEEEQGEEDSKGEEETEEEEEHIPQAQSQPQSASQPCTPAARNDGPEPIECARMGGVWASPILSPAFSAGAPLAHSAYSAGAPTCGSDRYGTSAAVASPGVGVASGPMPHDSPGVRASAASLSAALSNYKAHMRLTAASPLKLGVSPWQATVSPQQIAHMKSVARQRGLLGPGGSAGADQQ